jgi:hypothetical protein
MNGHGRKLAAAFEAKVAIDALKEHKTASELAAEFEFTPPEPVHGSVDFWCRALLPDH